MIWLSEHLSTLNVEWAELSMFTSATVIRFAWQWCLSVRLSVTLCIVAKRYIPQQKCLNKWIGSVFLERDFITFTLPLNRPSNPPPPNCQNSLSTACDYTARHAENMSGQTSRKFIAACIMVQSCTPYTYPILHSSHPHISPSEIAMLNMLATII